MISMKNASKSYDKTFFNNVNIFVELGQNYTIISDISENNNIILKMICGIYKIDSGEHKLDDKKIIGVNEEFFFIPNKPNYSIFIYVQDIIDHYKLYYNKFDIYTIGEALNSIGVTIFDKLSDYSFSKVKLLYLILAIFSNASYIFIEDLFDDIDHDISIVMRNMIQEERRTKRSFIFTSKDVNDLKDLVGNIIYNVKGEVGCVELSYLRKFFKCSVSFKNRYLAPDFKYLNPLYLKIYHRSVIFIFIRNKEEILKFVQDPTLIQYDELKLDLTDILYCVGDVL